MNSHKDVEYRLNLSVGFLKEAEEDFRLKRWRSCVDNSQLSVENAGKAILTLFGISPKTHEPAKHLSAIVKNDAIPEEIRSLIKDILPDFLTLGLDEHFMTDYGDEATYTLPWELFDEESARNSLDSVRLCQAAAVKIVDHVHQWRANKDDKDDNESES